MDKLQNGSISRLTKLDALTSLRFFAAMLVFIFHASIFSKYQTGYLGVSFFFVLSGFILTYNYKLKFKSLEVNQIYYFFISRFSKIYPVHVLTFLIAIPCYFFINLHHQPILYFFQGLTNLFLIQSYIPFGNISFNGVSWSLSDEFFFYALFPFILYFTLKRVVKNYKRLITIGSVWFAFLLFFMFLPNNNDVVIWFTYYFPGTRILEFVVGLCLGLLFLEIKDLFTNKSFYIFSIFEGLSIILIIFIVVISPSFNQNLRYGLIFIPFCSFIIFIFALQKGILSNFISKKVFVFFGEISFSFYMVHNLVLTYIYGLWSPDINTSILILCCLGLSIGLSIILYLFYEEPMRKRVKKSLNNLVLHKQKRRGIFISEKYSFDKSQ